MGSWVTRVLGFSDAKFQFPMPFRSRIRVTHGTDRQTDGQTDRERLSLHNPTSYGSWGITINTVNVVPVYKSTQNKPGIRQRTDKTWFSRLLRHPAWKGIESVLTIPDPTQGPGVGAHPRGSDNHWESTETVSDVGIWWEISSAVYFLNSTANERTIKICLCLPNLAWKQ